jgi:hypothetical protein
LDAEQKHQDQRQEDGDYSRQGQKRNVEKKGSKAANQHNTKKNSNRDC